MLLCAPAVGQELAQAAAVGPRPLITPLITQPVDESQRTTLKGNTPPLARARYDLGAAPGRIRPGVRESLHLAEGFFKSGGGGGAGSFDGEGSQGGVERFGLDGAVVSDLE